MAGGLALAIRLRFHNHAPQQLAIRLAFHQQAADELGGNQLSGTAEEGLGQGWEGLGGYGSGFVRKHKCHPAANPTTDPTAQATQHFASI